MKKLKFKKVLSVVIFIFVTVFLVYYFQTNWRDFREIHIVSWWSFSALILLTPVFFWFTALFFKKSVEPYNLKLSFNEYFGLTIITFMGNYLIPFSGIGARAVYMKKKYAFSYDHFLMTVIVGWITNFLLYAVAGIVALIFYYLRAREINWILMTFFLIVFVLAFISFFRIKINIKSKMLLRIFSLLILWYDYLDKNKKNISRLFYLTFWQFITIAFIFYFAYLTFGFKINFIDSFLPATLSLFAFTLRLVPGSFGFYEASVTYPSLVIGLSIEQGLAVAVLTRLVMFFWIFLIGSFYLHFFLEEKRYAEKNCHHRRRQAAIY